MNSMAFGNTIVNEEPSLIVMAKSGLKLRLTPEINAPVLGVISYGEKVEIIKDDTTSSSLFRIEWVEGTWIKVKSKGQIGYIFDGFVSILNVPLWDAEFSSDINNLSIALYTWAFNNYEFLKIDTLAKSENSITTVSNLSGNELFVHDSEQMMKVEFSISNIRIMDAYHLIESMMDTRSNRSILKENSVFFENQFGKVNRIKINGGLIVISEIAGQIKISCQTIHQGC